MSDERIAALQHHLSEVRQDAAIALAHEQRDCDERILRLKRDHDLNRAVYERRIAKLEAIADAAADFVEAAYMQDLAKPIVMPGEFDALEEALAAGEGKTKNAPTSRSQSGRKGEGIAGIVVS